MGVCCRTRGATRQLHARKMQKASRKKAHSDCGAGGERRWEERQVQMRPVATATLGSAQNHVKALGRRCSFTAAERCSEFVCRSCPLGLRKCRYPVTAWVRSFFTLRTLPGLPVCQTASSRFRCCNPNYWPHSCRNLAAPPAAPLCTCIRLLLVAYVCQRVVQSGDCASSNEASK
jgi:hypothetical protein